MSKESKELGAEGERRAVEYLIAHRYNILATNYKVKSGEIDIVCQKEDTIIFVEVKTRKSEHYGRPGAAVNFWKQRHIIKTAEWFLKQYHIWGTRCRFDVIEVLHDNISAWKVNHIKSAFEISV